MSGAAGPCDCPLGHVHDTSCPNFITHECVFVEEKESSGRLVLPPCIVCGLTAMDALDQLRQEVGQ